MEEILVPIAMFATVLFVVWIVSHNRYKARVQSAEIVKDMIAANAEVTPEIIKSVGFVPKRRHADLRSGMILIAIGIAFIFFGGAIPDEEGKAVFGAISMFPILIGIALIIFWYAISRKEQA